MSSTFNNAKKCAGKDCDRVGKNLLKVRYLKKSGLFCDFCTNDLIAADLVIKIELFYNSEV
jgi:hypothetical protein